MTDLATYLRQRADRCSGCGFHVATQGCACAGQSLKFTAQASVSAARPDDRSKVDAAIRQLAATRKPFSANDARSLHGVRGGVVGAAFTAAHKSGLIKPCGDDVSTSASTHGHRVYLWTGEAA